VHPRNVPHSQEADGAEVGQKRVVGAAWLRGGCLFHGEPLVARLCIAPHWGRAQVELRGVGVIAGRGEEPEVGVILQGRHLFGWVVGVLERKHHV
jgi:hypothetical protein